MKLFLKTILLIIILCDWALISDAQSDTLNNKKTQKYFSTRKGWIGKLAKGLLIDTPDITPVRSDVRFQKYKDKIIRNIFIEQVGVTQSFTDTITRKVSKIVQFASKLHYNTRSEVIRKFLFFNKNDRADPFLLADNERYLRDQTFIQDARIVIFPVRGSADSVDAFVFTKDVLSLGGSLSSLSTTNTDITLSEDNIAGTGNRIAFRTLYDQDRVNHFGTGAEYIQRNIKGSFMDAYLGYNTFRTSIANKKEETVVYASFIRPLVNAYTKWAYSLEGSVHKTENMYLPDSIYIFQNKYSYSTFDTWSALNFNAQKFSSHNEESRFRAIAGLRFFNTNFLYTPKAYENNYNWRFANSTALLGSFTLFRQDFFKAYYFYGFGRTEDIPEGINMSVTAGYTNKEDRLRTYLGLEFERYYFNNKNKYFNFNFKVGSFLNSGKIEDVNLLGNVSYYDRLKLLGSRWKHRMFLEGGVARQINKILNEPLVLQSTFGLPEFNNGGLEGEFRGTLKAEDIFYSPWAIVGFRIAPFVFANCTVLTPNGEKFGNSKVYPSLGGGFRTRNEALVFGTIEVRGYYFPVKNIFNKSFRADVSANLKFKYNTQFVKKPSLVNIN
ncbi:hypothetical protein BH09BAC2_BH09BAC2_10580 [soil metagenome]